jgi:hypothetical protein
MPTYDEMTPAERRARKEQVDREYQEKRNKRIDNDTVKKVLDYKQSIPSDEEFTKNMQRYNTYIKSSQNSSEDEIKGVSELEPTKKTYVDLTNPAKVSENLQSAPTSGYGSGWPNESERHSLASQGVITTAPKPYLQQSTNPKAQDKVDRKPSYGAVKRAKQIFGKVSSALKDAGGIIGTGVAVGSSAVDFARESNIENEKVKAGLRDWEASMSDGYQSKEEISKEAWARNYESILAYSKELKQAVLDIRHEKALVRQSLIKQLEYNRQLNAKWEDKLYAKQKEALRMTNDDLKQQSIRESCRYQLANHRMETKNSVRQYQIDIIYWSEIDSRMSNMYSKLKRQIEVHKPSRN